MKLAGIVPWGRSLEEYELMFSLSEQDKGKKILGCGDGPASFNVELSNIGGRVVSVDPIYQFSKDQINSRIGSARSIMMEQIRKNENSYVWKNIVSPDALEAARMSAMRQFLSDYDEGKKSQRYINAALPELPFSDKEFDLAVCSHFLFLYSEHFSRSQHIKSVIELCRVAKEIRVYPLISLDGAPSKHLSAVIDCLSDMGTEIALQSVDYEFQKGATRMLAAITV